MKQFVVLLDGGVRLTVEATDFVIHSGGALEFFKDGVYCLVVAAGKWVSVERVQDEAIQK